MVPVVQNMDLSLWSLLGRISLLQFLAFLGVLAILYVGVCVSGIVFRGAYSTFLGRLLGHNVDLRKMGQWAVITGATDGIGKAYVEELARLGLNIVLISRSPDRLKDVSEMTRTEYKVETKTIVADFTEGLEIYDIIRKELEDLQIGVLINNVGMSYPYPEILTEIPNGDQFIMDIIHCNCVSCTMMCRIVLPGMQQRGKGVVLNLSSASSVLPFPLLSVYSASKMYVDRFSQGLYHEFQDSGIIIQSVVPFYVWTKLSKMRGSSLSVPTPKDYVKFQLSTIGLEARTYGYFSHKVFGFFAEMLACHFHYIHTFIVKCIHSSLRSGRDGYLRNKQKFAKEQ